MWRRRAGPKVGGMVKVGTATRLSRRPAKRPRAGRPARGEGKSAAWQQPPPEKCSVAIPLRVDEGKQPQKSTCADRVLGPKEIADERQRQPRMTGQTPGLIVLNFRERIKNIIENYGLQMHFSVI